MFIKEGDTIAAISTPLGESGIGIVRLSGPESLNIATQLFLTSKGKRLTKVETHRVRHGFIIDPLTGKKIDEVLLTAMLAPHSFTCEDVIEISCHGGYLPLRQILDLTLQAGARLAEPGEFTKRAFLNGRIDLTQAEAIIDLIRAKSEASLQAAMAQLQGDLSRKITGIKDELVGIAALLEAHLEFPEEDIESFPEEMVASRMEELIRAIDSLLETFTEGKLLREGVLTVIAGRPNVGKSSLLNALLKENRAIVTPYPGTTRDSIEEMIVLRGLPITLVDTAGIRETENIVEIEGVSRTHSFIGRANLILLLFDGSEPLSKEDLEIISKLDGKPLIPIVNKIDLPQHLQLDEIRQLVPSRKVIGISAREGAGLDELKETIVQTALDGRSLSIGEPLLTKVRHRDALLQARVGTQNALASLRGKMSLEFIAVDINAALLSVGEILGDTFSEDVLDKIFRDFCIGK